MQNRRFVTEISLAMKESKAIAVATTATQDELDACREEIDALQQSISVR